MCDKEELNRPGNRCFVRDQSHLRSLWQDIHWGKSPLVLRKASCIYGKGVLGMVGPGLCSIPQLGISCCSSPKGLQGVQTLGFRSSNPPEAYILILQSCSTWLLHMSRFSCTGHFLVWHARKMIISPLSPVEWESETHQAVNALQAGHLIGALRIAFWGLALGEPQIRILIVPGCVFYLHKFT